MNNYCARFNANNIPKDLQKLIKDDMEVGINKRLEELDQTVRDLLQIVSGVMFSQDHACILTQHRNLHG